MAVLETMTIDGTVYNIQDSATRTGGKIAVSDSNGKLAVSDVDSSKLPKLDDVRVVTIGTTDLTAGTSPLATGAIHLVYEE